jgi:diguanylate cyclase (GGDEF)-like protein
MRQLQRFSRVCGPHREARQRGIWIAVALLLVTCGTLGMVFAARLDAKNDRQQARATFRAAGAAIAATLTLAAQHEEDLVVGAGAYIASNPNASEAAFKSWSVAMDAFARYPELEGGGEVVLVTAARLGAFAARERADPAIAISEGRPFQLLPPGLRPFYCLVALSIARKTQSTAAVPPGFDYCAQKRLREAFLATRASGTNAYLPYRSGSTTVLVIESPIYRGGVVPDTIAKRLRAFIGTFSVSVLPEKILAEALRGHPGMTVELLYGSALPQVGFRVGRVVPDSQRTTVSLGYGWTMQVSGGAVATGTLSDPDALTLLVGGIAVSVLLGLLVFVLGTSRARAIAIVREKTREISHQALHDALTGLPNRALVLDQGERMLARARRNPEIVPAALYVDIDRFKHVNDTFGHAAGDQLLRVVAERLKQVVRDEDTVGRLGGDEFIVLLESSLRERPPELVAERIIEVMRSGVTLDEGSRPFTPTVSIGIAIGERASTDQLLRDADLALYMAKGAGKDRAVLFESTMQSAAESERHLEVDLDAAIRERQLFLLYQPIIDLGTGEIDGMEALVRWRHPQRGVVEPADFIPFAEKTGQIMAIGRLVLEEACQQAAAWAAQGHRISMSVNVSACQLDQDAFPEDVRDALESSGVEPSMLTLEITETALMRDVAAASERLRGVRELGVRVALDDIGTGSSALAYLRHFAPDSIKIDRSITAGLTDPGGSAAIIHILVEFGKIFGIDVLAEGIEVPEQLAHLQRERCDHGQGFLFAQPLDADEIARLLTRDSSRRTAATIL